MDSIKIRASIFTILFVGMVLFILISSVNGYSKDNNLNPSSELVTSKWQENEDNNVEKIFGGGRFIIEKKYLNTIWASIFKTSSYKQVFYVYDSSSKQRKEFFEINKNDRIRFVDMDVKERVIKIISIKNDVEVFIHTIDLENKIIDVSLKAIKAAVFFNGYIYISSDEGFSDKLIQYNLSNDLSKIVVDRNVMLFDLKVVENKIVIAYSLRNGKYSDGVYLQSYDAKVDELVFNPEESTLIGKSDLIQYLSIHKSSDINNIYLHGERLDSSNRDVTTSVFKVVGLSSSEMVLKLIEKAGDTSVFLGVCSGKFLFGKDELKNKKLRNLSIDLYTPDDNKPANQLFLSDYNSPVVLSMGAFSEKGNSFLYINYSKYESKKRKDGWYSWEGYDVLKLSGFCE